MRADFHSNLWGLNLGGMDEATPRTPWLISGFGKHLYSCKVKAIMLKFSVERTSWFESLSLESRPLEGPKGRWKGFLHSSHQLQDRLLDKDGPGSEDQCLLCHLMMTTLKFRTYAWHLHPHVITLPARSTQAGVTLKIRCLFTNSSILTRVWGTGSQHSLTILA